MNSPSDSKSSPFFTSEPSPAILAPKVTLSSIRISSSFFSANSIMITASAPSGMGAPVLTSIHVPSSTLFCETSPAIVTSKSFKEVGLSSDALKVSLAFTA